MSIPSIYATDSSQMKTVYICQRCITRFRSGRDAFLHAQQEEYICSGAALYPNRHHFPAKTCSGICDECYILDQARLNVVSAEIALGVQGVEA